MKILFLESYDDLSDPEDHLTRYQSVMQLYGFTDAIWCRTFATILKGAARTWFNQLPMGSIASFD